MGPIIYRIDKGNLKKIARPVFTTGDSYVIVDKLHEKIYIWLGSKCSADEKGAAAVQARGIDEGDEFNGGAKILTYDEGDEPAELVTFLGGLKVLDKNLATSMLKDVSTGEFAWESDHVNALYKISSEEFDGINAIKAVQVPFEKSSLDSDDVMIADLGVDIWVWQGKSCNVKEKVKGIQIAREFDIDRAGAQRPKVFIEGDIDEDEFLGIFEGKLPQSESRVQDLKLETFDQKPQKIPLKKEKKSGLCIIVMGSMFVAIMLLQAFKIWI
ncbi:hypothetical protein NEF87_002567 [Candidatus Lokiarchaeum ossiferum]|uniref:Gelsolin-like domain-containing protein n=1 Tax=Candidatus Lokiarchaeum ossiferum TaxID=2951803 RepID=A0ABY6HV93_9ARCH|nr:hypothetical protein NEF87_002567 [Candidatus Lokiarchaeum sp. B-35]